jgi:hypothetical protein
MADVQIGSAHAPVRAREAAGEEREVLLRRFVEVDPAYAEYERRTKRRLPVVVLEPFGG